jgi:hypothetical protein
MMGAPWHAHIITHVRGKTWTTPEPRRLGKVGIEAGHQSSRTCDA